MKTQQEIAEMAEREYPYFSEVENLKYITELERSAFIKGYQVAQGEMKKQAIRFLDSIRDYELENGDRICNDERSSEKLYDIFISKPLKP